MKQIQNGSIPKCRFVDQPGSRTGSVNSWSVGFLKLLNEGRKPLSLSFLFHQLPEFLPDFPFSPVQPSVFTVPAEQTVLHVANLQGGAEYCVRAQVVMDTRLHSISTDVQCVSITGTRPKSGLSIRAKNTSLSLFPRSHCVS